MATSRVVLDRPRTKICHSVKYSKMCRTSSAVGHHISFVDLEAVMYKRRRHAQLVLPTSSAEADSAVSSSRCAQLEDSDFCRGVADAGDNGSVLILATNAQLELMSSATLHSQWCRWFVYSVCSLRWFRVSSFDVALDDWTVLKSVPERTAVGAAIRIDVCDGGLWGGISGGISTRLPRRWCVCWFNYAQAIIRIVHLCSIWCRVVRSRVFGRLVSGIGQIPSSIKRYVSWS